MNATKSPSTEQLLEAIRREAAQLDLSTHPEPEPLQQGAAGPQVTTRLPLKPVYHYREFLPFDDETFITNAIAAHVDLVYCNGEFLLTQGPYGDVDSGEMRDTWLAHIADGTVFNHNQYPAKLMYQEYHIVKLPCIKDLTVCFPKTN